MLNTWWQLPAMAVDTHIFRVAQPHRHRPGPATSWRSSARLEDQVPAPYQLHAHHWLILHGRYVCIARKPPAATCLIRDLCAFEEKNL